MDSSITPLRHGGLSLVQTTDFFYPLVEDPYMQGKLIFRNTNCAFARSMFLELDSAFVIVIDVFSIIEGKIACANVLSDLYAMGVTECDNMLMLLAISTKMSEKERDVIVPLMMRGFKDCALEAGSSVTGGQTVMNPWCTIGGVATTVCQQNELIV